MTKDKPLHQKFTDTFVDLVSERIGGETLSCSDDFFAPMENLIKPGRGIFIDDKYTDRGKWMDGWESRRRFGRQYSTDKQRDHDWCTLRLGIPGYIRGVDIDTNHFRGNAPQSVSIEACVGNTAEWVEILPPSDVKPHSQNLFSIDIKQTPNNQPWTCVRLKIFPDGGVARLRVYGEAHINWQQFLPGELIDLAAIQNGGRALSCSDMFFSDKNNLLMPGRGVNMGDGWETKRRRDKGNDWVIIKLASEGSINKVLIDTHHFKGNFPDRFSLEGICSNDDNLEKETLNWQTILPQTRLFAHREHQYSQEIISTAEQTFTHVRLNIFPDGGVSRLRLYGYRKGTPQ